MKKIVIIGLISFLCVTLFAENNVTVKKIMATDSMFSTPESVNYDEAHKQLYVSNINREGNENEKDNGYISKISITGQIIERDWITGLKGPKGADIYENKLLVTDIDRIVEINIDSGQVVNTYPCKDAKFLNDLIIDKNGTAYISDSSPENSVIYSLENGQLEKWLEGKEVKSPNGLYIHDGSLYFGNSGDNKLKKVNLETKEIETVAEVGFGIDGLRMNSKGDFILSDWQGKTVLQKASGEQHVLINTSDKKINSADLEYLKASDLLFIPTFFDNRVFIYKVEYNK